VKVSHKVTLSALLLLAAAGIAGLILTDSSWHLLSPSKDPQNSGIESGLINQQFLDTARRLSALATTPEEQTLAGDALRISDQELDLEFAAALQATARAPASQTPAVRAIQERITKIEGAIQSKQDEVAGLEEAVKKAKRTERDSLEQQMDVSKAELGLYKEWLGDAKEDLIRAGGDPHSKIQHLVDEHEASSHAADSLKLPPANSVAKGPASGSLVAKYTYWQGLRHKQNQILDAAQEAYNEAGEVAKNHDQLEQELRKEQPKGAAPRASGAPAPASPVSTVELAAASEGSAEAAVSKLKRLSEDRRSLAMLGRRIQDLEELGSTYDKWAALLEADQRAALGAVIASGLWVVLMLLIAFAINRATEHFFSRLKLEFKQRATLQTMIRIGVQVATVAAVLIVILGPPSQLSTVLGLAGAGLTVVLKDFIVSFLGWFVIMGRQGIRVGDWVEINGVRGEVIEITLLRTILLETGNWTEAGQPTGRQIGFLNQYAIEGTYFNFSTSGQWLWDELQVLIPRGQDPYPVIEKIRNIVAKETEGNMKEAEHEWQRVSRRYGMRSFSAEPALNVRPTDSGVAVVVRYVTRAQERAEVRYRLNHAVVRLLQGGGEVSQPAEPAPAPVGAK
jgi:small-conductance mechanosensitive channel